jgi:hypothetical protein
LVVLFSTTCAKIDEVETVRPGTTVVVEAGVFVEDGDPRLVDYDITRGSGEINITSEWRHQRFVTFDPRLERKDTSYFVTQTVQINLLYATPGF